MWNGFSQVILQLQLRGGDDHNHHSCRLWKVFWSLLANFWAESRSQSVIDVNGPQLPHTWKIILEEEGEAQQTKSPPPHTYQDKTPRALKSSKIQLTNNQAIEKSLQAWKSTRNLTSAVNTRKVIFPGRISIYNVTQKASKASGHLPFNFPLSIQPCLANLALPALPIYQQNLRFQNKDT